MTETGGTIGHSRYGAIFMYGHLNKAVPLLAALYKIVNKKIVTSAVAVHRGLDKTANLFLALNLVDNINNGTSFYRLCAVACLTGPVLTAKTKRMWA